MKRIFKCLILGGLSTVLYLFLMTPACAQRGGGDGPFGGGGGEFSGEHSGGGFSGGRPSGFSGGHSVSTIAPQHFSAGQAHAELQKNQYGGAHILCL